MKNKQENVVLQYETSIREDMHLFTSVYMRILEHIRTKGREGIIGLDPETIHTKHVRICKCALGSYNSRHIMLGIDL